MAAAPGQPKSDTIQVAEGLHRENLYDGHIIIYRVETVEANALDAGMYDILTHMDTLYHQRQLWLVLFDVTSPAVTLVQDVRIRLRFLNNAYPQVAGRTAILLSRDDPKTDLQMFIWFLPRTTPREKKLFFSESEALLWLAETLPWLPDDSQKISVR
jgi:hypothetical protein